MNMKQLFSALPIGELGRQLVHGGLLVLIVRVLSVLASLLSSVVLARVLGAAEYGVYAFVFAIISILALPVQMGLPTLIVRETSKAVTLKDWPLLSGVWAWATWTILAGSITVIGCSLIWFLYFSETMRPERHLAFLWGLPLIPLLAFSEARTAALIGLKRMFLGQFPDTVLRPMLLACFVGVTFFYFQSPVTAQMALGFSSIAALLTFMLGTVILFHVRPKVFGRITNKRMHHRTWFNAMLPLSMITGLYVINSNADLLMLGWWRSDAEVGNYRVALSISSMATFGLSIIYTAMLPHWVSLFALADIERLQKIASIAALLAFLTTSVVVIILYFAGLPLLSFLYGEGYEASYLPLIILSLGSAIHASIGMGGGLLTATGNDKYVFKSSFLTAILNIFLNYIFIPVYGLIGAAVATSIALVAGQMLSYYLARRVLRVDGSPIFIISKIIYKLRAREN